MRKFVSVICLLLVAMLSVQCGQKRFEVGDLRKINDVEGVVFEVSDGGVHGKILSLDKSRGDWHASRVWCESIGNGWRMPTREDLAALLNAKETILNHEDIAMDGTEQTWYLWSSTEGKKDYAWSLRLSDGDISQKYKVNSFYIRAVAEF